MSTYGSRCACAPLRIWYQDESPYWAETGTMTANCDVTKISSETRRVGLRMAKPRVEAGRCRIRSRVAGPGRCKKCKGKKKAAELCADRLLPRTRFSLSFFPSTPSFYLNPFFVGAFFSLYRSSCLPFSLLLSTPSGFLPGS